MDKYLMGCLLLILSAAATNFTQAGQLVEDSDGFAQAYATGDDYQPGNYAPNYYLLLAPNNTELPYAERSESAENFLGYELDFYTANSQDVVFDVTSSGGTCEFIVNIDVYNRTKQPWAGFQLRLGYGTGENFVAPAESDGLDFDSPEYNLAPSAGSTWATPINAPWPYDQITLLAANENNVLRPRYDEFITFLLDIPDGITQFTLRHTPIPQYTPEPTSLALLLLTSTGLLLRRRRHSA